jgi:Vitamin-D-receptor interacting Mediator subunit 4
MYSSLTEFIFGRSQSRGNHHICDLEYAVKRVNSALLSRLPRQFKRHPPMADLVSPSSTEAKPALPLGPQLLSAINDFSLTSQQLLLTLSAPHSATSPPPPESLIQNLSRLDQLLASLLAQSKTHARNQARIESLVQSIKDHDQKWRQDVIELEEARRNLGLIVEEGRKDSLKMESVEQGPIPVLTLVHTQW